MHIEPRRHHQVPQQERRHHQEGHGPREQGRGWHGHHDHHDPQRQRGGPHRGGHGRGPGGQGDGPGGRARRGAARYVLLDALRDGPKHGYELIKTLEERSSGQYVPSPGTVYPTLQMLEDQGLVRADQGAERRVYQLTETGQAELAAHAEEVNAFWARFTQPAGSKTIQTELNFMQDELDELTKTVWSGLRGALERDDPETIRRVRLAVEQCKNEVRRIIVGNPSAALSEEKNL